MSPQQRPDIVLIMADDMGFSDIGCYGGEIATPALDALGRAGTRFTQFYNSPRCSPTRASLLTGLHPHQVGIGILTGDERPAGYPGDLSPTCHTIAELLREAGYGTYLSGKWHLSADMERPSSSWPNARGFDRTFGTIEGAGSYYAPASLHRDGEPADRDYLRNANFHYTEAIGAEAARFVREHDQGRPDDPLFLYLPFTAPHWPLHATEAEVEPYLDEYRQGWDVIRARRHERLRAEGILDERWAMSPRDPNVPSWWEAPDRDWQASRMAVYAAQVSAMDRSVASVLDALRTTGRLQNSLVLFLSDNGACEEELPPGGDEQFWSLPMVPKHTRAGAPVRCGNTPQVRPGPEDTFASYGREWANVSNTPFREYKHWVHEGGIATPFIVHWPAGFGEPGTLCHQPAQLVDVLPTLAQVAGAHYPNRRRGQEVPTAEGSSLVPLLTGQHRAHHPLFWEHEGNAAVRSGDWKLVRKFPGDWELYDLTDDLTELVDQAAERPELVTALATAYGQWARRVGVIPREQILQQYRQRVDAAPPHDARGIH